MTDDELTDIYNKANGLDPKRHNPITTERIFAAMRAAAEKYREAYLEHCGALEACDIMIEVRDKMIDARTELLRRALPMLSGAGAGVLAAEICECIGMRSNA